MLDINNDSFQKEWNSKNHVMLDIETLSTGHMPVMPQISAVQFNPWTGEIFQQFDVKLSIDSMIQLGCSIDESTFRFWMSQGQDVIQQVLRPPAHELVSINQALINLSMFIKSCSNDWTKVDTKIWGNGPSFDAAKIVNVYKAACLPLPWQYTNERCVRTILAFNKQVKAATPFVGNKHDGRDDSIHQATYVNKIIRSIFDAPTVCE